MRDAPGLTLDQVYQWRSLLEECGPKIVYTKSIHNTIADAISRLEYDPSVTKHLRVTANHAEENEIYPLTAIEIAKAQQKDQELKVYCKQHAKTPKEDMRFQLIEDTKVPCKNDKLIILASLRHRAVSLYHHYLQHPD
jgi:hypothetical protein